MAEGDVDSVSQGMGLAGAAVLTVLLDELVNKGVLTTSEVGDVLVRAHHGLTGFYESQVGREAGRVIAGLLTRFPRTGN